MQAPETIHTRTITMLATTMSFTMLHPVRLKESGIWKRNLPSEYLKDSEVILKIGLMENYLKNLVQGTYYLKHSRKQGCIFIKKYIKRLNTTH